MIWYVFAMIQFQYRSFMLSLACLVALVLVSACATSEGSGEHSQLALDTIHEAEKIIEANTDLCELGGYFQCLDIPVFVAGYPVTESKQRYERPYKQYDQSFVYIADRDWEYRSWAEYCSDAAGFAPAGIIVICEDYLRNEADKNDVALTIGHELAHITIRDLNNADFSSGSDKCKIRRVKSKDLSEQDLENIQAALAEERKADYYGFYFAVRAGYDYKNIARVYHSQWGHGASTSRCHEGGGTRERIFSFIKKEIEYLMENGLPIVPQKHNFFERYWEKELPIISKRAYSLAVHNHDIANIAYENGDYEKAERLYSKALELYEEAENTKRFKDIYLNLIISAKRRGVDKKVKQFHSEALKLYKTTDNLAELADKYFTLGQDAEQRIYLEEAEWFYSKSAELYEGMENTERAARSYLYLGLLFEDSVMTCDHLRSAKSLYGEAEDSSNLEYTEILLSVHACE